MRKQQRIQSFFKVLSNDINESPPPSKRQKHSEAADNNGEISNSINLSPEQKKKVNDNKLKAKILIYSKKYPALSSDIGVTWFSALENHFQKEYFAKLSNFLVTERKNHTIYPPPENVFSWTRMCPLDEIKVVILGQDPYHGPNQAHGLAFSVLKGVNPPPSLLNMYKELVQDIEGFVIPKHGNLSGWARQGVLLLNACLTVRSGQANSHKDRGWENLTDAIIKHISDNLDQVVFLLWGAFAQKKADFINKKKHHILKTVHPSPLSACRGFFGCKHFSKTNEFLVKNGKQPVDWKNLPPE